MGGSNCLEFICTRPAMKICVAAFAALVVSVSAAAVDKDKELDAAQDLIINLNKASTLDRKLAYRCGMFFPDPKDPKALPVSPLLVFNASWPAEKGSTIGNDICKYIKDSIKAPFVGGKSKKFPEGLQIGMFSNACGDAEWRNAEKYHKEKVCCKAGEYRPCDEL